MNFSINIINLIISIFLWCFFGFIFIIIIYILNKKWGYLLYAYWDLYIHFLYLWYATFAATVLFVNFVWGVDIEKLKHPDTKTFQKRGELNVLFNIELKSIKEQPNFSHAYIKPPKFRTYNKLKPVALDEINLEDYIK